MARVNEAGDRTPTTQEHWERYADELLVKLERAEAGVKGLEELLRLVDELHPDTADRWRASIGERLPFREDER
jgi:hypothetical protein